MSVLDVALEHYLDRFSDVSRDNRRNVLGRFLVDVLVGAWGSQQFFSSEDSGYVEFLVLENCTVTAIEQDAEATRVWFNSSTAADFSSVVIEGRHFGCYED